MTLSLSNHLAADSAFRALRRDVLDGLCRTPKSLPPKWFYDSVGSDLFDQITRLPEYYPTRAEAQILRDRTRRRSRAATAADTLVELGSGTSEKTRLLLDALARPRFAAQIRAVRRRRRHAARPPEAPFSRSIPGVEIEAVCGDFEEHLARDPGGGRRLFVFLGSTIGNLTPGPRAAVPCRAGRACCSRGTACCWAPTWSRTPAGWCAPTTTPPG